MRAERRLCRTLLIRVAVSVLSFGGLTSRVASAAEVATAAAPAPASPPAPAPASPPFSVGAGLRTDVITSRGLDPFSEQDVLPAVVLSASWRLSGAGGGGFAIGAEWNNGVTNAELRSSPATLTVNRLLVSLAASRPLSSSTFVTARVAAGAIHVGAQIDDGSAPGDPFEGGRRLLSDSFWAPSVEAAGGMILRLGEVYNGRRRPLFALAFHGDLGYSYAPARHLSLATDVAPVAGRTDEPVHLGTLAMRGPFARIQLALSF